MGAQPEAAAGPRILVTGATGFVGAVLMPELLRLHGPAGLAAYVLPGDRIPASWAGRGVTIIHGDIADRDAVREAVGGATHVVHLAGLVSYWRRDRERLWRVNREGVEAVVEACLGAGVRRLVHVSSVGAVGFHPDGRPADEDTPFNWPSDLDYMASKRAGEEIVLRAVRERGLRAVVLDPASIMGPGDHQPRTPHNALYRAIGCGRLIGSFAGGLAVVDVRDLTAVLLGALRGAGRDGERYLVAGANLPYAEVVRLISRACGRRAYPVIVAPGVLRAAGGVLEGLSRLTGKRPLLTAAYGRLSGWTAYYDNGRSRRDFGLEYRPVEETVRDGWDYFRATFGCRRRPAGESPR